MNKFKLKATERNWLEAEMAARIFRNSHFIQQTAGIPDSPRFVRMMRRRRSAETAIMLMNKKDTARKHDGLKLLAASGLQSYSLEAVMLDPIFERLFLERGDEGQRALANAKQRLEALAA